MPVYKKNLLLIIAVVLFTTTSLYSLSLYAKYYDTRAIFNFAGIVPIVKDQDGEMWAYFGVEYKIKKPSLAILGGKQEKKDSDYKQAALRELTEESLGVFSEYINEQTLNNNTSITNLEYNLLFLIKTNIFLFQINKKINNSSPCDEFITNYNNKRSNKRKLKLAQRETFELRRVKLNDLAQYLGNPSKFNNKLISYGGRPCLEYNINSKAATKAIPMRWSSKILLQNNYAIDNLVKK